MTKGRVTCPELSVRLESARIRRQERMPRSFGVVFLTALIAWALFVVVAERALA
jgi:hypothetical protein